MALTAMTTTDTVDYVSDFDPSKKYREPPAADGATPIEPLFDILPGATVFKLRGLDVFLMGYIYDGASSLTNKPGSGEVGIHTRTNQTNIECVRHGLVGLDNFVAAGGGKVVFKTQKEVVNGRPYDVAADEIMNRMGVQLIQELAAKIKKLSEVSAAEEKKSVEA